MATFQVITIQEKRKENIKYLRAIVQYPVQALTGLIHFVVI